MSRCKNSFATVLSVINFIIILCLGVFIALNATDVFKANNTEIKSDEKYVIYIGTNDKDTYKQEISTEQAKNIVDSICVKYTDGFTSLQANGGWVDETNTLTQENTLIYVFYEISQEQLENIMDDILEQLNQNSILIEKQQSLYTYYNGE